VTATDVWDAVNMTRHGPHYGYQNRYLVRLPGEPKAKTRRRVTTVAKAIEDQSNLRPWHTTMGIVGTFADIKVKAKWAALLAEHPAPWETARDELTGDDGLIEASVAAGGSNDRRDIGTALHRIMHVVNRGDTPNVDGEFADAVRTYQQRLDAEGLRAVPTLTEMSVWIPRYDVVGTFDVVFEHDGRLGGKPLIMGDFKTGGVTWKPDLDYRTKQQKGWRDGHVDSDLSEAMQLAIYGDDSAQIIVWPANSYDECQLLPMPDIDRATGVIIHLPVGENVCTARYLDLEAGRAAVRLAIEVMDMRKVKPLLWRHGPDVPPVPGTPAPDAADNLTFERELIATRVRALPQGAVDFLARKVADHGGLPRVSQSASAHLDVWADLLVEVEAEFEVPFEKSTTPVKRKAKT